MASEAADATTPEERAGDVYAVALRERPVGRVRGAVRVVWGAVATGFLGLVPAPSEGDLIVTRRSDGAQLLRTQAGDAEAAAALLAHVEEQLATLSAAEFAERWSLR